MRHNEISMKQVTTITLEEAREKFMNNQKAKGNAKDTLLYYDMHIRLFEEFLIAKEINSTREIGIETIEEFIIYSREKNPDLKDISINTRLRAVRSYCYFLMKREYMNRFDIPLINAYKEAKEVYTDDEIKRLIEKPNIKKCTFVDYRNWVIICHLLATGNRARTIRNIKNRNVDLKNRIIMFDTTKNKKSYEVPISSDYYSILVDYMNVRKGESDDFLFCTYEGKKLSRDGLRATIEIYCKNRGVEKTSLHLFRHLFAKTWIMSGGSSKKLQTALGHECSYMVDEYLSIYGRELEEDFDINTPLAQYGNELKKEKIKMKRK